MIAPSGYNFNNPKMNEIKNIIEKTIREDDKKYKRDEKKRIYN